MLGHDGYLPTCAYISKGKKHEGTVARNVPPAPGSIFAIERGYNDQKFFDNWTEVQYFFIIQLKENADYGVIKNRDLSINRNFFEDQLLRFIGFYARKNFPHVL